MARTQLIHVIAYVSKSVKRQLEAAIKRCPSRMSTSAYVESVLRKHLEEK